VMISHLIIQLEHFTYNRVEHTECEQIQGTVHLTQPMGMLIFNFGT